MGYEILALAVVVFQLVVAILGSMDAKRRGYSGSRIFLIFFMILLIPILGIILYLILRPAGTLIECPRCKNTMLSHLRKCPHCGLKRKARKAMPPPPPPQPARKVQCPHCGQPIEQAWKTCPHCSRKISFDATIIDEVFLMYRDGRLIKHFTRRLKPDVDQDILSSMLTAVQDFIRDSFRGETGGDLDHMKFGRFQILMGHGRYVTMAAVMMGDEIEPFRPQIIKAIDSMEADYEVVLRDWQGDMDQLNVLGRYVMDLIDGRYS